MIRNEILLRLFSGDTQLLETFARRIDQRDIAPRSSDPLSLRVALHAYGNYIAKKIDANPERIRQLQQKLMHDPHEHYHEDPLETAHW